TTIADAPSRPVRVLLAENLRRVRIGSAAPFLLVDRSGMQVHVRSRAIVLRMHLKLAGHKLAAPLEIVPGAEPLTVDGRGYRGSLSIGHGATGLTVINTVALDLYLDGVVPSEMPRGWQPAAYEAQAVAARSY